MSREGGGLGGHMVQELRFGRQATAVFTPLVSALSAPQEAVDRSPATAPRPGWAACGRALDLGRGRYSLE